MIVYFSFVFSHVCAFVSSLIRVPWIIQIAIIMSAYSLVAFCFDPVLQQMNYGGEGVDLYRHFTTLDLLRIGSAGDVYMEAPLSALYMCGIAYAFDNNHMLPLISVWMFYGLYFYYIYSYCQHLQTNEYVRNKITFLSVCFMVFFGVMNNIRYPLAVAMYALVLYKEMIKDEVSKLWYIIPVLMHPGMSFTVIIRLFAQCRLRYCIVMVVFLVVCFGNAYDAFVERIISACAATPDLQKMLFYAFFKLNSYSSGDGYVMPLLFRITSLYIFAFFIMLCMIAVNYKTRLMQNKVFARMVVITILLVVLGWVMDYMNGNFVDRIIGVFPFYITLLCTDVMAVIQEKTKITRLVVMSFIYIGALSYVSIWLFRVYFDWIYGGL